MAWDFETDPEYQELLDWADEFVRTEVEPLDYVFPNPYDKSDTAAMDYVRPLKEEVKRRGLWACHLGPELGGPGYGQLKLALLNEILGRSVWAPSIFGCQAPDTGNAEILAHYGTEAQKAKYLQPLMDGDIGSCYVMTEPQGGSDPTLFKTTAVRDGDEWILNGEKWFNSEARHAAFWIVMAVTNTEVSPYQGMSMFIVDPNAPVSRSSGTSRCTGSVKTRPTPASPTPAFRPRTCWVPRGVRSPSHRRVSVVVVYITPCARWPRYARPST